MTTNADEQTDTDLGWSLGTLLRGYREHVNAAIGEFPHGQRGYETMCAVVRGDQPSQLALATHLGIDRTVMTYLLDAFEGCGLVERQLDPADRRARRIVATDKGLEVLAAMQARVAAAEEELLSGLEPDQRLLLRHLLERAATGTGPDDDPCRTVVQATKPA